MLSLVCSISCKEISKLNFYFCRLLVFRYRWTNDILRIGPLVMSRRALAETTLRFVTSQA